MRDPESSTMASTPSATGSAGFTVSRVRIPLKVKFLGVLLLILLTALGTFFYVAQQTFAEDKKLFVMDLNLSALKATTSELKMEIKSRLEELQVLAPRIYLGGKEQTDVFQGLSSNIRQELIAVSFFRKEANASVLVKQYSNQELLTSLAIDPSLMKNLSTQIPSQALVLENEGLALYNRSQRVAGKPVGVLTFQINGTFLGNESKNLVIIVDFLQDFLRKRLQQSDLAEQFLIFKNGTLLAHPSLAMTVDYANKPFPHPVVERLQNRVTPRESLELEVQGEPYLTNVSGTGFSNVFAISQTKKSEAFIALRMLFEKTLLLALIILSSSILVSVYFAARLTTNIKKLRQAAQRIGSGELDTQVVIRSYDEIQNVAESFQWMTNRLKDLIVESTVKARLEDELETARLVQSTILSPPNMESDAVELSSHYVPATQCGGDYWDAYMQGNLVTLFIGDATGHGAPAAIVTAVAKSCFSTLNTIFTQPLPPEQFLGHINNILYNACRGKLLMTMCVIQLDLETGELIFANAGHESPLLLRASDAGQAKQKAEVLFSRGERLGFSPNETYIAEKTQLSLGDVMLLYTDGVSEARDPDGKEWGERALKKIFANRGVRNVVEVRDDIVRGLAQHTKNEPQPDDVTFVLMNWNKAVVAPQFASRENTYTSMAPRPMKAAPVASVPKPIPTAENDSMSAEEKARREAFLFQGRNWQPPKSGSGTGGSEAA